MDLSPDNFDELFRKELENVLFPKENIDEDVRFYFPVVLTNFSMAQLQCDLATYESLVAATDTDDYNLYNLSFVLNAIAGLRPKELDLNPFDYTMLLKDTQKMSDVWNGMVKPIRTKLMNKLQTQQALQGKSNGKIVNPGLRRN